MKEQLEDIKLTIGNAYPEKKTETMEVKGRHIGTGLPSVQEIENNEIRKCLKEPIEQIVDGVKGVLEQTPPELSSDIHERGIILTGGGCLLRGIDQCISKETNVPVFRAEDPLTCVVLGTGKYLEELRNIKTGLRL